jgi:hypothetical protein
MRKKLVYVLLAMFAAMLFAACEQDVKIDPDFSVNIFMPGPKWPNVKKLSPQQKEVYQKYGRPDCFRVWWNAKGELKGRGDAIREFKQKGAKQPPAYSWVYLEDGREVVFSGARYEETSLSDRVRVLAKNGDPEDIKEMQPGITQWMFYSTGKLYKFAGDRIVEEKDFPAMGKFQKI